MALIIFDYDGVLADTIDDLLEFGQEACNKLGVKHLVTKDDLNNLEVMSFASYGRACEVPEYLVDEFVKICLDLFAEKKSPPAIFTGLSNVVRYLSLNHMIAVVTTNSSQNVNAFLVKHGLNDFIHATIIPTEAKKSRASFRFFRAFRTNGEEPTTNFEDITEKNFFGRNATGIICT